MAMHKRDYREVWISGRKAGVCAVCGKNAARSKKFYQTVNPYNKNKDGSLKTETQIRKEILKERTEWRGEPIVHTKCEEI